MFSRNRIAAAVLLAIAGTALAQTASKLEYRATLKGLAVSSAAPSPAPTPAPVPAPEPAPIVYATWNPDDKSQFVTLTNGNLSMTNVQSTNWRCVRSTVGKSSGAWYWEYRVDSMPQPATGVFLGVAAKNVSLDGFGNAGTPTSVYWLNDANRVAVNGALSSVGSATFSATDVVGIELVPGNSVKFYRNGVFQFSRAIPEGTYYAQVCAHDGNAGVITARFNPAQIQFGAAAAPATIGLF